MMMSSYVTLPTERVLYLRYNTSIPEEQRETDIFVPIKDSLA